jgi:hypothetical protein
MLVASERPQDDLAPTRLPPERLVVSVGAERDAAAVMNEPAESGPVVRLA